MIASTQVATTGVKTGFVFDFNNIDYDRARQRVKKHSEAIGAGGGFTRTFPGDRYDFRNGDWVLTSGKTKKMVTNPTIVLNVVAGVTCWQKWEGDEGKRRPKETDLVFLADPDGELPSRDTLGDDDPDEWELYNGKPQDPWKPIIVFPCREQDETTINHVMLSTVSGTNSAYDFFGEIMSAMPMHAGEIPVVKLGARKVEREITEKDRRGRDQKVKQSWFVPTFEVVEWIDRENCDNPGPSGSFAAVEHSGDVGKVETVERTQKALPSLKAEPIAKRPVVKAPVPAKPAAKPVVKNTRDTVARDTAKPATPVVGKGKRKAQIEEDDGDSI